MSKPTRDFCACGGPRHIPRCWTAFRCACGVLWVRRGVVWGKARTQ